jgi:predicted amidohydrolase YtcJ
MNADVIVTDARVLTMDSRRPQAEALAIKDGKILALGSKVDIAGLKGPGTRVISAQNKTVLPGFIESHMHLFGGGGVLHRLDLTGLKGLDAVGTAVRSYVATQPNAKVLFARGADYSMLGAAGPFTRHILDRMVPDRPFAVSAFDFHTMWANTKALAAAGLLHGRQLGPGNEIVMGDDGLATGELRESEAYSPLIRYSGEHRSGLGIATGGEPDPKPTPQEFATDMEMLKRGLSWCARHGITSIQNMDGNLYTLELLTAIQDQGGLLCRVKVPFHFKNFMKIEMLEKASLMAERYSSDWLSSGLVKAFCDGVLESYTAFMHDDYADRPGYRGDPLFTQEQFTELAIAADRRKLQMAVHCIGDGAVNRVLNSYEEARKRNGKRDSRHRIEHIEVIIKDDVPRFGELGVIASMQPPHPPGAMDFPEEPGKSRIGAKRWPLSYAWRTLKTAGAHVAFSSDWPVADINILRGIQAAVTRKPWTPDVPSQAFSLMEAIAAYTSGSAYAEFAESKKGALKEGYFADVVVLSGAIEATPSDAIGLLSPAVTICGGRVTYEA